MHKLLTTEDLKQPQEVKTPLIERARQLSRYFEQYKAQDAGGYSYTVEVGGEKERAAGIHASEVSKCQRLVVYSISGVERKKNEGATGDPNMQMRFNVGHALHAMLQNDMARMCDWINTSSGEVVLTYKAEQRISPELGGNAEQWGVYSACDGEFTWWHKGDPYLRTGHEIKTASGPSFDKNTKPEDAHYEQTTIYMATLELPLMWVQYYNKSNSYFTAADPPYLFQFDEHLWQMLEIKFAKAHHQAETGQLPDREEGRHCRWCPFTWTCKPPNLQKRKYGPSTTARSPGALRR
jgi:CRISPR/Cas system-associated exonuclease Cas4 (RecB family)